MIGHTETRRDTEAQFRVPGQEKGTSENEVPGFVGAYTQTHINTRLVEPDRARWMRMSETHTHLRSPEKLVRTYVNVEVKSNRN